MPFFDDSLREKFHNLVNRDHSPEDWEAVISIGTAARILSLSVSALRKYEKEGLLLYHRTPTGRRLLCRADINRVRMIKHLVNDLGLNMEGIRRLLALLPCWELMPCTKEQRNRCIAAADPRHPCWMTPRTECARLGHNCRECNVYRNGAYATPVIKALLYDPNPDATDKKDDVKHNGGAS